MFFLNNETQVRFALVIIAFALILFIIGQIRWKKGEMKESLTNIGLISYIILIAVPYGLICYHGDPMEVDRHALGNIIRLNVGVVLLYMLLIDLWITRVQQAKEPDARPREANPLS